MLRVILAITIMFISLGARAQDCYMTAAGCGGQGNSAFSAQNTSIIETLRQASEMAYNNLKPLPPITSQDVLNTEPQDFKLGSRTLKKSTAEELAEEAANGDSRQ